MDRRATAIQIEDIEIEVQNFKKELTDKQSITQPNIHNQVSKLEYQLKNLKQNEMKEDNRMKEEFKFLLKKLKNKKKELLDFYELQKPKKPLKKRIQEHEEHKSR